MGCFKFSMMICLRCIFRHKRKNRSTQSAREEENPAEEVTVVKAIYLPLSLQDAMEEPRPRESEQAVLNRLADEGLLKSETLNEKPNSKAFYISLDGNPYPSGKPRLLEPIQVWHEKERLAAQHKNKMMKAVNNRKNRIAMVERKDGKASAKVAQAKVMDEERRRILKERLDRKMEAAARNRLLSRGK